MRSSARAVEWPTLLLLIATYAVFGLATAVLFPINATLAIVITGVAIAQFSSLQHEVLHGHPFQSQRVNEALVFPALTLTVPYARFRDQHLAHHHDPHLTDPYDDPESNYLDPAVWNRLSAAMRILLTANNTLLGRIVIGPILGNIFWLASEARLIRAGNRAVIRAWMAHAAGLVLLGLWLFATGMPVWAYLLAIWIGQGLLKIRTFLEHRAHELCRARTVLVEDRGPLALLFLNNNLHVVHHAHPNVAWYRLPGLYAQNRSHYVRRNEGYVYRSYAAVFRSHFTKAKDPVPHPLWTGPSDKAAKDGALARIVEERHTGGFGPVVAQ